MQNKKKHIIGIICIAVISFIIVQSPWSNEYIHTLKRDAVTADSQKSELELQIDKAAAAYKKEPQDAKIDPVWKAIPGYNGIEVDREASLKKMEKSGSFDEKKLVFKQIRPKVHLDDLPAAPIYRGHPEKPMVSFAINVAWGEEYLPEMLSVMKKHGVHATFFFEGRWVTKYPEIAKMIVEGGHEAGNHSFSHPVMAKLSKTRTHEEMIKTNQAIEASTEQQAKLFAPPSGSYREETVKEASNLGMKTILWTVDTIDWKKPDPDVLVERVMSKVHPGAIILMHPTEPTAKALPALIERLKEQQLKVASVSELLKEERIFPIKIENNEK